MRIYITGIAGFLGSQIADDLIRKGHEVAGCDTLIGGYLDNIPEDADFHQVDCRYLNAMKKVTRDTDVVIHTASSRTTQVMSSSRSIRFRHDRK